MKTINIKGKNYIMVNERLKAFRENFKGYSLLTEIVEMTDTACTMKASILNDKREVVATGFAREVVGKTPINKFAFVENAETSAWGRALGNFGIGIDDAICTAEELNFKLEQEKESTLQAPKQTVEKIVCKNSNEGETQSKTLKEDDLNKINMCKNTQELLNICANLRKKLGDDYYQAIKDVYKRRNEDLKNEK